MSDARLAALLCLLSLLLPRDETRPRPLLPRRLPLLLRRAAEKPAVFACAAVKPAFFACSAEYVPLFW